jgi:hypothetical protein
VAVVQAALSEITPSHPSPAVRGSAASPAAALLYIMYIIGT